MGNLSSLCTLFSLINFFFYNRKLYNTVVFCVYVQNSNPLPEEESPTPNSVEPKKRSIFQEQIRAERESFKAVFDRRRHRIGGLDVEED